MAGRQGEEIDLRQHDIGRPVADFAHPFLQTIRRDAETILKTRNTLHQLLKSASGRWYLLRLVPYLGQQAEMSGVIAALVEVTALKESQLAARNAERIASSALNSLDKGVCAVDEQGHIILANDEFRRRTGFTKAQTGNTHFTDWLAKIESNPPDWQQIRNAPQLPENLILLGPSGHSCPVRLRRRPAGEAPIWIAILEN